MKFQGPELCEILGLSESELSELDLPDSAELREAIESLLAASVEAKSNSGLRKKIDEERTHLYQNQAGRREALNALLHRHLVQGADYMRVVQNRVVAIRMALLSIPGRIAFAAHADKEKEYRAILLRELGELKEGLGAFNVSDFDSQNDLRQLLSEREQEK